MTNFRSWRGLGFCVLVFFVIAATRPVMAQPSEPAAPVISQSGSPTDPPPLDYALLNQPGPLWLPGADFSGQDLYGVDLAGANLRTANFDGATLANADLSGALLVLGTLRNADLTGAIAPQATLSLADLRFANMPGADFAAANMQGARLDAANLDGAKLSDADLRQSEMRRVSLRAADLSGARLSGSNLQGADLTGADLREADLSSVNLSGANLFGAKLDDISFDRVTVWPENFDVETMVVIGPLSPRENSSQSREQELAITMTLMPSLIGWFNQVARPQDSSLIDRPQDIQLLDEMRTGSKMVVFKSVAMAEEIVPHIADKFDTIGYNLEHGPLNPLSEQADPVGSVQRMRTLADDYGLKLALGPDHSFALSHGEAMAPYVDAFAMQVQRVQSQPAVVREFVVPMAAAVRAANPAIETSLQVRTEGEAEEIAALIDSVRGSIDSVAILSSQDTVETAHELVDLLRAEDKPAAQATIDRPDTGPARVADQGSSGWALMLGLGLQFLVIGLIALVLILIGRAASSRLGS